MMRIRKNCAAINEIFDQDYGLSKLTKTKQERQTDFLMTKWSYLRMCQHKKEPKNQSQIEQNCEQLCFDRAVPAKER